MGILMLCTKFCLVPGDGWLTTEFCHPQGRSGAKDGEAVDGSPFLFEVRHLVSE